MIYLICFTMLVIGGLINLLSKNKQFIVMIIFMIVGFWASYLQEDLYIWFAWFCWAVGFIAVNLVSHRIVLKKPIRTIKHAISYSWPRRLTLKHNPRIHAWLWWDF